MGRLAEVSARTKGLLSLRIERSCSGVRRDQKRKEHSGLYGVSGYIEGSIGYFSDNF